MGFFSSLKKNLNHGGVKLELTGPGTISLQDASAALQVTVNNTSEQPVTINSMRLSLQFEERNKDVNNTSTLSDRRNAEVSALELPGLFVLQPNESKLVNMILPISAVAAVNSAGDESAATGFMAKAIDVATAMNQFTDDKIRNYFFCITTDVEGIKLDPSKTLAVQVLTPGEVGTKHFKIGCFIFIGFFRFSFS